MEGLSSKIIKNLFIPIPSNENEQSVIVDVLSDIDSLISKLDQLIQKKKNIKQGAMQELLTGKRRLPGFSGEWKSEVLGDHAVFMKGRGLPKSSMTSDGKYECIHYGELFNDYTAKIEVINNRTNQENNLFSETNDVLMPTSDVTPTGLAKASCIKQKGVVLGGDVLVIRPDKKIEGIFLSHQIRRLKSQIMSLVKGSTVYHLHASDMKRFEFPMPDIDEQVEIVNLLSTMEEEIDLLETRKNKYIKLKQGMMQQLLTGKIRLI
jgi:type I restriction enzyme S subunit